jgi:hypothetical protein
LYLKYDSLYSNYERSQGGIFSNIRMRFLDSTSSTTMTLVFKSEDPKQDGRLNHISFFTDSAEDMRVYLASNGIKVPEKIDSGQLKNLNFNVSDPDGHTVEFVQYLPESWTRREQGKYIPDARISKHRRWQARGFVHRSTAPPPR